MAQSTQELRREIEGTREHLGETLDSIGDRVSPGRIVERRKERVRARFRSVRDAVMGSAESVQGTVQSGAHAVQSGAHKVAEQAGSAVGAVTDQVREAPQHAISGTKGNPLAAGLITFGVGFVVASAFPATRPERRAASAVEERLEPVKEHVLEAGQEMKSALQESATEAAEQVKSKAGEAAQEVKTEAQSAASDVKDDAKGAAHEVQETAQR